jgi:hemoglobin-like flavoprotein
MPALPFLLERLEQAHVLHRNRGLGRDRVQECEMAIAEGVGKMHAVISAFGVSPASNEAEPSARPGMLGDQFFLGRVAHKLIPVAFADRPCPPELAEVVMKMVDLRPAQRYPSVAKAMDAFEEAIFQSELIRETSVSHSSRVTPDPPASDVVARAEAAYERWRRLPRFFESFYETLFAKDPTIRERFSPLAREEQPAKLRGALKLVLDFPKQRRGEKPLLAEIAQSHAFEGKHNIPPHLYPSFERALLDTASRRDEQFDDRDRQAWRAVLSYTFDYMQSRYY